MAGLAQVYTFATAFTVLNIGRRFPVEFVGCKGGSR
jgi:hypothetical protein